MYLIIKKDKAEHLSEKLHDIKAVVCEVMEYIDSIRTKEYDDEDLYRMERTRHDGRMNDRRREDDYEDRDEYYGRDMARGRGRMSGRSRY